MPVQIHINGENAGEAIKELSVLASHLTGTATPPAAPAADTTPKADKPSRSSRTTKPEPAAKEETSADPEEKDESEESNAPTVVELRAKAQEVGTTPEAKKAIKALLDEFGAASVSVVPEEQRAAFLKALEGLA